MAFDPSGRLFYTQKNGAVRLFANGKLQDAPVMRFSVDTSGERGLLGIAVDPAFNSNHYVYVYYTCSRQSGDCPSTENRVVRFVENNGAGASPQTIFTSRQTAPFHVGGNIHFGPDGKLYVTIGETGNPANSQDVGVTQGKIHRLNPDGTAPGDNPNLGRAGALPTIYAYGLRNSFDFAFDPVSKRLFASENGPGCDDELNLIQPGANYGWRDSYPCDDAGPDPAFNTIRPLWYLPQGTCCVAPTGVTIYSGGQIPQWTNHIFMANYKDPLYHFTPDAGRTGLAAAAKVQGLGPGMDIETGPDGALYYIEGGGYQDGTLKRITGPGGPPQPPAPGPSPVPTVAVPGTGSTTFPETGMTMSGLFRDYWNRNGALPQQGFPISRVMGEVSDLNGKPYTVQYFERAVFEYHPENQPPFNVLLSQLGTFRYRQKYPNGAPGQKPNTTAGSVRVPETGKRLGGLFLKYWQEHGGLPQQGYPISDEFMEKSDLNGKEYLVQYFERAVFELHPENAGNQYEVLLSQLGTFRYREKYGK
jgi:glucose/arabinose dehydrogenase